jgi:hypothetical protein
MVGHSRETRIVDSFSVVGAHRPIRVTHESIYRHLVASSAADRFGYVPHCVESAATSIQAGLAQQRLKPLADVI